MSLPASTSPVWSDVILGRRAADFEFIGARMLVVRLRLEHNRDPSCLARITRELHDLFGANQNLRSVQNDLQKLASPR